MAWAQLFIREHYRTLMQMCRLHMHEEMVGAARVLPLAESGGVGKALLQIWAGWAICACGTAAFLTPPPACLPPLPLQLVLLKNFMMSKVLPGRAQISSFDLEMAALQAVHTSGPFQREDGSMDTALPCDFLSAERKQKALRMLFSSKTGEPRGAPACVAHAQHPAAAARNFCRQLPVVGAVANCPHSCPQHSQRHCLLAAASMQLAF